jgi:hypothetical protein
MQYGGTAAGATATAAAAAELGLAGIAAIVIGAHNEIRTRHLLSAVTVVFEPTFTKIRQHIFKFFDGRHIIFMFLPNVIWDIGIVGMTEVLHQKQIEARIALHIVLADRDIGDQSNIGKNGQNDIDLVRRIIPKFTKRLGGGDRIDRLTAT